MVKRYILALVVMAACLTTAVLVSRRRPTRIPTKLVASTNGQRLPGLFYGLAANSTFTKPSGPLQRPSRGCNPGPLSKLWRFVEKTVHAQVSDPCSVSGCGLCSGHYYIQVSTGVSCPSGCTGPGTSTVEWNAVSGLYAKGNIPACATGCSGGMCSGSGGYCSNTVCDVAGQSCADASQCSGGQGCISHVCSPCVTVADCSGLSGVRACVAGQRVQCGGDEDCDPLNHPNNPVCDTSSHTCVPCTTNDNPCARYDPTKPYCVNGACVQCNASGDNDPCPGCQSCDTGSGRCVSHDENCPEWGAPGCSDSNGTVCDSAGCCKNPDGGGGCDPDEGDMPCPEGDCSASVVTCGWGAR